MEKNLYDLTAPQKSILLTEQYYKGSSINNVCGAAFIEEQIDFDLLKQAVTLVINNNTNFHIKLCLDNNVIKQYICDDLCFDVEIIDVYTKDDVYNLEKDLSMQVFDIFSNLFMVKLFHFDNNYGGFILNAHHLISDSWTLGLFAKEVVRTYSALAKNEVPDFSTFYSYEEYMISEKEYIGSEKFNKDKDYWNSIFSTVPEVASIPGKNLDVSEFSSCANRLNFTIPKKFMDSINSFCKSVNVSAFNFFMAIFAIYTGRVSNLDDFVIGTPILNRTNFKEKNTLGMFINIVPCRINLQNNPSFQSFVTSIAKDSLGMLRHQKYSYQYILEDLRSKNPSLPNLYNMIMSYQITKANTEDGLSYNTNWSFNGNCGDDLDIHMFDLNDTGSIDIAYDYRVNKYSKDEISAIHARILHIIDQVIKNSNICIDNIEIVTEEEKNEILYRFNDITNYTSQDRNLIELFNEQVNKYPDKTAVTFYGESLTYAELDYKSSCLATYLSSFTIMPEDVIGIFLDKSIEMIVGILAILKVGGCYLPIDIDYPDSRITYMLNNSNTKVILSDSSIQNRLNTSIPIIDINLSNDLYCNTISTFNAYPAKPNNLAYIMYTSGSTGNPKGVMIEQKSITRLVKNTNFIQFLPNDRILQTGSIVFDACTFEIWGALLNGLELYIIKKEDLLNVSTFEAFLNNYKISVLWLTAPLFNQICEENPHIFKSVRCLLTGGDVLSTKHINMVKKANPNLTVINGYGPTENTTFSCCYQINDFFTSSIPIGKPISGSSCYVVSKSGELQPIGVPGELLVGGDGVARGYLNNPVLTNSMFLTNTFDNKQIYKTGDLVKWLPDGSVEFIGRIDNQVKIRGFRVELNEINTKILESSFVKESFTTIYSTNNNKFICSYLVMKDGAELSALKTFLKGLLPSYMIPTYFVTLPKLPINTNGKVDKNMLPTPSMQHNNSMVVARNSIDSGLIDIVKSLLNIEFVDLSDSFLDIGGDSLSSIRLSAMILDKFDTQLSVKDIMTSHSLIELSDKISSSCSKTTKNYIPITERKPYYPLSSAQSRIYYATKMAEDNNTVYNISGGMLIDAILDNKKIEDSFKKLIQLHSSFRTCFKIIDDMPQQIVLENVDFSIKTFNSKQDDMENIINNFPKAFDLSNAPLLRVNVHYLDNKKTLILIDSHHIIIDGTSLNILIHDFCNLYNNADIENSDLEYIDYAVWENNYINSNDIKNSENYWLSNFKNAEIPVINLPYDYNMPVTPSYVGDKISTTIPKDVFANIDSIAKEIGCSSYMVFLAIFYVLLYKYTSQDDIIVGSPIANRDASSLQNIIGMFVNNIALNGHIDSSKTLNEFLKDIKMAVLEALANQPYPYDLLVKQLNLNNNNLFDVMFTYQNMQQETLNIDNHKLNIIEANTKTSKFNLSLEIQPHTNTLNLEYRTDLFKKDTVVSILNHYVNLLNNINTNMNTKISDISMLSKEERNMILYDFNNTATDYPKDKTIIQLFEEQVRKTPDNIAVVFEDKKLTYKELNEKANSLAWYLRKNNIGRNDVVCLFLDKSLEMIIAILSSLKLGCSYLPIDINYPDERINYILNDSHSKVVLTTTSCNNNFKFSIPAICIDFSASDVYDYSTININTPDTTSSDIAYIMYTSGSTGNPKGVMVKNINVVRLVKNTNFIKFEKEERILQTGSIVFDACTFEIWAALLNGFELYIIRKDELLDSSCLQDYLLKNSISILWLTAPLFNQICEDNPKIFSSVRCLLTGGDVLSPKHISMAKVANPNLTIINGYGPTENTTFSCCFTIDKLYDTNIPIGKPISNSTAYIVSTSGELLPVGCAGELWVGGDGVAKGYLNNQKLTDEKFIQNPFGEGVVYKTGDLAKWLPDGNIEFLGRIDTQVKIRGFRVELSEIDFKIQQFSNIKDSTTVVLNINNNKTICSYVVAKTDNKLDFAQLRKYLQQTLPNYMIPVHFMQLDKLPLNTNGKIDKKALPNNFLIKDTNIEVVNPINETEEKLLNIFKSVLNVNKMGTTDNFFEFGGDSLIAMKVQLKANNENISITYSDVFKYPTVKDLAIKVSSVTKKISISKATVRPYYPASSAQKRMYLSSSIDSNSTLYNITGGILLDSMPDINKLQKAFDTIIARHDSLRTYFDVIDGNIVQKIDDNLKLKLVIESVDTNNIDTLFEKYQTIFALNKAPLFKAYLLKLPNTKVLLMLDVHHSIFDGTSLNNFMQELSNAYNGIDLPKLPISYKDFAVWEEEQLLNDGFKDSKSFWIEQYSGDIPLLNMPTTYTRPATKSYDGHTFITYMSSELTKKINAFATSHNVTPYMLMLSIYYILLYKYTSQEDIIVGSPISGRPYEELEALLGMFVNSLPLRNTVSANIDFEEFLSNVKNSCINAFSHQDYPFDMLVNDLNIARDNSRSPLFDTMFIYQNNGLKAMNFDGINATYCLPKNHTAKFDLSVEVSPQNDVLRLSFEYCTKLFDEAFIEQLSSHYNNILNAILENPNIKIANIDMLSNEEKHKILYEFNDTKVAYPSDKTIATLFEEQVNKTPNNIAVVFEDKKLTYKELNEKANQLAWYLNKIGIGKGSVIGIMLPRCLEVLISILGVLKVGACYIPIDPTLPTNRINYMLSNSNANMLLCINHIPTEINVPNTLNVSLTNTNIYLGNCNNLNIKVDLDSPSYMIYTSGSTGTPKGVILKHKALTNLATYLNGNVEFLQDEYANIAMASITTISFDIFIFETLICLQRGLKIVIANEAQQNTPNLLDELIVSNNVKAIQMTPSRMYIFIHNKDLMPHLANLKYIVLAGEALPKDLLNCILEIGNIKVYNGYGPSETTVFSTFTDVTNYDNITIGKPLANTRIYILDKDMNIVPVGIPGEMYIAGTGVGIGYANNNEITKKHFIRDIFYPNEIMYKTGDLAKYLPNGELHYIGRIDHQIKIRGLRIELDEIEKCILQYPNVDKCIISADKDNNDRQFIVAYLTVTDRISINKLRMFLKTLLPKYMIPSYFIILDKIPYLNNGKINKKALPKPDICVQNSTISKYVAPRNRVELQIATIFQSLLSISPIGIDDNFFELGGDSLLAINLQVELLKLNLNVTYSDIFMYPTIKELAKHLSSNEATTLNTIDASEFAEFNTILDKACLMPNNIKHTSIGNILISGTTGFLGSHILDSYLKNEKGIAYCLIRPEPGLTLENKLVKKLHFYFGNKYDNLIGNRIVIVNSDIVKDNLGLSNDEIQNIFKDISCVVNCAAKVSHYGNYNDYKKINVTGTENLIKLCMQFDKRFYQISTLSVSGNSLVDQSYIEQAFEEDVIFRENNFYINQSLDNVYVRSKFEAEKIVLQYILKGLDGYIYRVGNLMNRYSDGKFQPNVDENAYISRLLSLYNIGCIPNYLLNGYMEFTPIDCCADAIIKLIGHSNCTNRVFHLYNHNHADVNDFINILKTYIPFEIVSNDEFINKINDIFKQDNSNKILSGILRDFDVDRKLVYESKIKLKSEFSIDYLSKIGFVWPKIDDLYIKRFLNYFYSTGYITKEEK
jgi:amino acid adenylation domain-containing protein/thioester reductase-like protein